MSWMKCTCRYCTAPFDHEVTIPDANELQSQCDQLRAEVERFRTERRWISVEERLPEVGVEVLCCLDECHSVVLAWRLKKDGEWICRAHVTHWMPLPPLP